MFVGSVGSVRSAIGGKRVNANMAGRMPPSTHIRHRAAAASSSEIVCRDGLSARGEGGGGGDVIIMF